MAKKDELAIYENGSLVSDTMAAVFKDYIQLKEFEGEKVIVENNCGLCIHPDRFEIEKKWEMTGRSHKMTAKWLDETKGFTITPFKVMNHMSKHYKDSLKAVALQEYGSRLKEIIKTKVNDLERLDMAAAICLDNMSRVAIMDTGDSLTKEKDRQAIINDTLKTMMKVMEVKKALQDEVSPSTQAIEKIFSMVAEIAPILPASQRAEVMATFSKMEKLVSNELGE